MKLRQALQGCSSGQLARIVSAWELPVEAGTLRRELVELIAEWLPREAAEPSFWSHLDDAALDVVRGLIRAGGRHDADLLVHRLSGGLAEAAREAAQRRWQAAVAGLLDRGILYRVFEAAEQRQGVYLVLPDELLVLTPDAAASGPQPDIPTSAESPHAVAACDPAADLFVLASALRREAWSRPSRGLAGRPPRSVGQILARLRAAALPGPGQAGQRWRFLLWLAQRAGWIDRAALPVPDDEAILSLLRQPWSLPGRALAAGPVQAAAPGRAVADRVNARPRHLQNDALQVLNELPAGTWWEADRLAAWVVAQLVGVSESARGGRLADQQRRTIERWLGGRWFWLGLVEWGESEGGWSHVRTTPAVRAFVSRPESLAAQTAPRQCERASDLGLLAPPGADLAILYRAEPYLTYTGMVDGVRQYMLTPPAVERGIRLGGAAEDLKVLLSQLIGQPVPEVWSVNIDRWSQPEQPLRLGADLILSADDQGVLAEALTVPGVQDAVAERLSPTRARIAGDRLASLLTDLAAAGLPVQIDPGLRAEPSHPGRAAALSGGAAEAAWIGLEIARRLAPDIVDGQRDLTAARQQLEAIFSRTRLESLERRVASLMATAADRRKSKSRRRVV